MKPEGGEKASLGGALRMHRRKKIKPHLSFLDESELRAGYLHVDALLLLIRSHRQRETGSWRTGGSSIASFSPRRPLAGVLPRSPSRCRGGCPTAPRHAAARLFADQACQPLDEAPPNDVVARDRAAPHPAGDHVIERSLDVKPGTTLHAAAVSQQAPSSNPVRSRIESRPFVAGLTISYRVPR
jgi:hypothetical protein